MSGEDPNEIHQMSPGDGTTTRQIKATPRGAVYVTPSRDYMRHLARDLGRDDIKIYGLHFFECQYWRGLKRSNVVVDHAACDCMDHRQRHAMFIAQNTMHD